MDVIKKYIHENKVNFLSLLIRLALPIAIQNLLSSSMALIDLLMIGQLNESAIAAVGIANQFVFVFIIVQFGVHSGVSIFTAQYWGQKDDTKIKKLLGIGILCGLFFSAIFTAAAVAVPERLMALFSKDDTVVALGAGYLRIVGIGFSMSAVIFAFMSNLRSIGIVKVPMVACGVAVVVNVTLNWVLIFGKLGMPALGVTGAAVATCISKFVEGGVLLGIVYGLKYPLAAGIKEMLDFDFPFFRKVLNTCWPVFLNEFLWVTGVSLYNLVYARIGTESIAAVNIVISIEDVVLIPFFGFFHAGAIIIGNDIGAGRKARAYEYGKYLLRLQFSLAVIAGGVMILSREMILGFYAISDTAYLNAYHLMMVAGLALCIKITNWTNVVSVLRGGGDTRFGFVLDLTGVWFIGVPLAFLGAFYFKLPVYWVMALVVGEEFYKLMIGVWRFKSRKWIRNLAAG